MNKLSRTDNILIVGLGLMGGSYAKRLSFKGFEVNAIDINQENLDFANRQHWLKNSSNKVNSMVSEADFIIFALYPSVFVDWIKEYAHLIKKGAIITDVTGVKRNIVNQIEDSLADNIHFVASHPMAGKESRGILYSDPTVFNEANFIITPTENSNLDAIEKVKDLARVLEFKNISILDLDTHDQMIAFLSQLTHVIAVSLMNSEQGENFEKYTGDSFRDLTRIAKINEKMWSELFLVNKDYLLDEMDKFQASFQDFRNALENEDIASMEELMISARLKRKKFDK